MQHDVLEPRISPAQAISSASVSTSSPSTERSYRCGSIRQAEAHFRYLCPCVPWTDGRGALE